MNDTAGAFFPLSAIFFLLILNGIFTAAGLALLLYQTGKVDPERKNRRSVRAAEYLLRTFDLTSGFLQFGASIISIAYACIGVLFFRGLLFAPVGRISMQWQEPLAWGGAAAAAVVLHALIAGLAAKAVALRYPEAILHFFAPVLLLAVKFFQPLLRLCSAVINIPLRGIDSELPKEYNELRSAHEISLLVSRGTASGVFDEDEEQMLRGVFGFSQTIAREVMTPRTDLVAIPIDAGLDDVIGTILQSGFSRFPVRGSAIDDIQGVVLVKDILPILVQYEEAKKDFSVSAVMRPAYFIPDTKAIDDLLNEFKRRKLHMAIVVDEHGGVDGLVTLEDLIEEIVGDIFDESDVAERDIEVQPNGDVLVDGGTLVADLNDRFDFGIPEGDYDTIAGFIFTSLGRMPRNQDRILINGAGVVLIGYPGKDGIGEVTAHGPERNGGENGLRSQELFIIVEETDNQRVESVRIKVKKLDQESESDDSRLASEA